MTDFLAEHWFGIGVYLLIGYSMALAVTIRVDDEREKAGKPKCSLLAQLIAVAAIGPIWPILILSGVFYAILKASDS